MFGTLLVVAIQSMIIGPAVGLPALGDPTTPESVPTAVSQAPKDEARPTVAGQEPPTPDRPSGRGSRGGTPPAAEAPGQPAAPTAGRGASPRSQRSGPFNPAILKLGHAECYEMSSILNELCPDLAIAVDERMNAVIISGSDENKARAEALIRELDLPESGDHGTSVMTVAVEHRSAEELAKQIQMILGGRGHNLRVAADANRAMVLLNGAVADANAAVGLLVQLDTPSTSVNLEFTFFHADANSKEADADIPADLAGVAKELKRFGRLEVLGRLSTTAVEHEEFKVEGSVMHAVHARVEGDLEKAVAGGSVRLRMRAMLFMKGGSLAKEEGEGKKTGGEPSFDLGTVVLTKPGDYVVLGSAPTGWASGESAILVLHVRP